MADIAPGGRRQADFSKTETSEPEGQSIRLVQVEEADGLIPRGNSEVDDSRIRSSEMRNREFTEESSVSLGRLDCRCSDPNTTSELTDQRPVPTIFDSLVTKYNYWQEWTQSRLSYKSPHEVVIYSDEEQREKAALEVLLQIMHTTTHPVISSSRAAVPCESLGTDGLLSELNEVLGTSYSTDVPGLLSILEQCIKRKYDFGTAFGRLRTSWVYHVEDPTSDCPTRHFYKPRTDFSAIVNSLDARERKDEEDRIRALSPTGTGVINPLIAPRRVWDLYSNRVIPTWVVQDVELWNPHRGYWIWAVSHSWMADNLRHSVDTPINGHEWLVPIPIDTTLDRIRVELLNLGAAYAWLDVLCLRQEDYSKPEKEEIRKEEWKLDVPIIGRIYHDNPHIVAYLSGLGRPFEIGDINNDRHWLNRAWTIQEGTRNVLVGGMTARSPQFPPDMEHVHFSVKHFYNRFFMALDTHSYLVNVFRALETMLDRKATNEVDRIAGLAYMVLPDDGDDRRIPVYIRGDDSPDEHETAWGLLIPEMNYTFRTQLAFLFPAPGDGDVAWRPSWAQLAARKTPLPWNYEAWLGCDDDVNIRRDHGLYFRFHGYVLEDCKVQYLAAPDGEGHCRRGKLTIKVGDPVKTETISMAAHHQVPIPMDHTYVLCTPHATVARMHMMFWMVGLYTNSGCIRKVSVLKLENWEQDWERMNRLAQEAIITLV
ncbi:hypothetical protein NM688_g2247 [Phlebia brevispora]|uniref:Uncharacterized protein n=1 Tax=Phlebia brevispora TaxID=194682 RepID=A0ACC1T8U0_9APHY|nr:hypothetical protein NM688_g2247 [Phlebia brevispora]